MELDGRADFADPLHRADAAETHERSALLVEAERLVQGLRPEGVDPYEVALLGQMPKLHAPGMAARREKETQTAASGPLT